MGIVEFATFEDSGQLTFTFAAYDDSTTVDACKTGQGVKTINATTATTTTETAGRGQDRLSGCPLP